jgi:hypothetical protein
LRNLSETPATPREIQQCFGGEGVIGDRDLPELLRRGLVLLPGKQGLGLLELAVVPDNPHRQERRNKEQKTREDDEARGERRETFAAGHGRENLPYSTGIFDPARRRAFRERERLRFALSSGGITLHARRGK